MNIVGQSSCNGTRRVALFCCLVTWASFTARVIPAQGATPAAAVYRVRPGDSLSVIAQRFGTTFQKLKADNKLHSDVIHSGDRLTIAQPFARARNKPRKWRNPMRHPGPVLRPFGPYKAGGILMPRTGCELSAPVGTQLFSPANGVVRHSGPLDGFGHILIIEHTGNYATVLAPCDPAHLAVRVGDAVVAGDPVARTAAPGPGKSKPYVHVELRLGDKAIDPSPLLR